MLLNGYLNAVCIFNLFKANEVWVGINTTNYLPEILLKKAANLTDDITGRLADAVSVFKNQPTL